MLLNLHSSSINAQLVCTIQLFAIGKHDVVNSLNKAKSWYESPLYHH